MSGEDVDRRYWEWAYAAVAAHEDPDWEWAYAAVAAHEDQLRARLADAEARLAKVAELCDAAEAGFGTGIYGTDVSSAEIRAAIAERGHA